MNKKSKMTELFHKSYTLFPLVSFGTSNCVAYWSDFE